MHVIRARAGGPSQRRTDTFTGEVWADPASRPGEDPTVNTVVFMPGGRTYWHRHELGQLLVGKEGGGVVVAEDGTTLRLRPGESVWTRPGEAHWHGADTDTLLGHVAHSFGRTEWLGEVDDDEYHAALAALRRREGEAS